MAVRPGLPLLAAAALLAGCQATGAPTSSGASASLSAPVSDGARACAAQGLVQGTPAFNACIRVDGERYKLWNRGYGNCGHCRGGSGGR